jgi:hypothetical protein
VLEWGVATLGGQPTRFALLKRPGESGTPLFAYLYETAPGTARAIGITAWGFSQFQGIDQPAQEPAWGAVTEPERGPSRERTRTLTTLAIGSRWIHGSFEDLAIGIAHGEPVVAADSWMERENNGHGFDTTHAEHVFARGAPRLAGFKLHAMHAAISAPTADVGELTAVIVESPLDMSGGGGDDE